MRVLYANQVFLDYRVPYYKELIRLFGGDFYVMFSPNRYRLMHRDDLVERIGREFGANAIASNDCNVKILHQQFLQLFFHRIHYLRHFLHHIGHKKLCQD